MCLTLTSESVVVLLVRLLAKINNHFLLFEPFMHFAFDSKGFIQFAQFWLVFKAQVQYNPIDVFHETNEKMWTRVKEMSEARSLRNASFIKDKCDVSAGKIQHGTYWQKFYYTFIWILDSGTQFHALSCNKNKHFCTFTLTSLLYHTDACFEALTSMFTIIVVIAKELFNIINPPLVAML